MFPLTALLDSLTLNSKNKEKAFSRGNLIHWNAIAKRIQAEVTGRVVGAAQAARTTAVRSSPGAELAASRTLVLDLVNCLADGSQNFGVAAGQYFVM